MKKILSIILCAVLVVGALTLVSCSKSGENTKTNEGKIKVVTTIFPIYDWVNSVAGENADITMLIDSGTDLHSFQPTADDIISISNADLFIYVGGESDGWAEDAVKNSTNPNLKAINLLEALGDKAKEEELKEGMQGEEEEDEDEEEAEYDEHIWLSLKNACVLVDTITSALCDIDSANSESYKANSASYISELDALDKEYEAAVSAASNKTLLFGDRFPFRYLTEDYSIDYYAAFIGCSAETEASFETVSFLAKKVDELNLKYVIALEGTDHKLAQTIIDNTKEKNAEIITFNSMQSITANDIDNNISYIGIMRDNLTSLKTALS